MRPHFVLSSLANLIPRSYESLLSFATSVAASSCSQLVDDLAPPFSSVPQIVFWPLSFPPFTFHQYKSGTNYPPVSPSLSLYLHFGLLSLFFIAALFLLPPPSKSVPWITNRRFSLSSSSALLHPSARCHFVLNLSRLVVTYRSRIFADPLSPSVPPPFFWPFFFFFVKDGKNSHIASVDSRMNFWRARDAISPSPSL